ncbi:MAG: poly-beta-1,6-N-acetyl-D-glucosamine N-deacetylase PgaB [Kangiellaceae bacterium]|nr:poly-beta-1,6-N-acetyl-D-glucosamine N-deacetylase PgaB [Kangiellaceae bacterium]
MTRVISLMMLLLFSVSLKSNENAKHSLEDVDNSLKYDFFAFCYHDVNSHTLGDLDKDSGAVNVKHLAQHFQWLKDNGYTVVSLEQIIKAKQGQYKLPEKAVYLTFDDGYSSFYTHIYPLLKAFNYPATFALVTSWIESSKPIEYGVELKSNQDFLTWKQVIEMESSGLIEFASHSHDLHKGIVANPQNNKQPAATSLQYLQEKSLYESEKDYIARIKSDLETSFQLLKKHLKKPPRALVWPYGSYSEQAWNVAKSVGFSQSVILQEGKNYLHKSEHISRALIIDNPEVSGFSSYLLPSSYKFPKRVVHVDLDYVYDPNATQQEKNISQLIERIHQLKVSTVYLQAFADDDGDGNASALYFPNRNLPMKADLFNRVSWQLKTRGNVEVYAWMPVSAFDFGEDFYQKHGVKELHNRKVSPAKNNYKRLSIFDDTVRGLIKEIYSDLAKSSYFSGLLFHDDAFLTDKEDLSPDALTYYSSYGLNIEPNLGLSEQELQLWSELKTKALTDFTLELAEMVRFYNPEIKTARNLYARPILQQESIHWFAQSLENFSSNYDYVAIMAMPYMEQADNPRQWFKRLLDVLDRYPEYQKKFLLELQAKDWRTQKYIDEHTLIEQMKLLQNRGYVNYGYYPDDFTNNRPALDLIYPLMSLNAFPEDINNE